MNNYIMGKIDVSDTLCEEKPRKKIVVKGKKIQIIDIDCETKNEVVPNTDNIIVNKRLNEEKPIKKTVVKGKKNQIVDVDYKTNNEVIQINENNLNTKTRK